MRRRMGCASAFQRPVLYSASARAQGKLAKIMVVERAMSVSSLAEREASGDVGLEGAAFDQVVQLLDDFTVGLAVIRGDFHARSRFGYRLDAVGMSDSPAFTHGGQGLLGGFATRGDQSGIEAVRSKLPRCSGDVLFMPIHDNVGAPALRESHTI